MAARDPDQRTAAIDTSSASTIHRDTFAADHLPPREQWPRFLLDGLDYPDHLNCGHELLDTTIAAHGGERPCLIGADGTWTYAQTLARVNRIAGLLVDELGIVPGNRILLRGPNNPWLAACWLAVMKAGAIAVATMPLMRAKELIPVLEMAQPSLALCDHRLLDDLAAADADLTVVAFGGDGDADLDARIADRSDDFEAVATAADDIALIAFTSGTTGKPKGCMHAHRDVLVTADTFSRHAIQPGPDDIFIGSPPLAFTFGLGQLLLFPLRVGAATILLEKAGPPQLAEAIAQHGATVCGTAPTAYRAMLRLPDLDLGSLRCGVSAGESLPEATWHEFHDRTGIALTDGIGATEMLHVFISAAPDEIRPGATGKPVPGYEARVVDEQGEPVADGEIGRLAVRGPTGCRYLADPRQREYVQDGWNLTGDAYVRDGDGYFWYHARTDDMIISSGYNIASPEVEDALLTHPDVVEVGVVGEPDDERGMLVKAFVVLAEGVEPSPATATALQDHVKATIAPYKYPRAIEFIDALPRTQTGKVQRYKLRDR